MQKEENEITLVDELDTYTKPLVKWAAGSEIYIYRDTIKTNAKFLTFS
jgi:hypothetical protein